LNRVRRAVLSVILAALGAAFVWLVLVKLFRRCFRSPAPPFVGRFLDSALRRWLQRLERVVERSGVEEGMRVLEIGCGSGACITYVARVVGEGGWVVALDLQRGMLTQLRGKLGRPEHRDLRNVRLCQGEALRLPFAEAAFDLVYMVTALPEVADQGRALAEVRRVLRPGGMLAVTEFFLDPDYPLASTTVRWAGRRGLSWKGCMETPGTTPSGSGGQRGWRGVLMDNHRMTFAGADGDA